MKSAFDPDCGAVEPGDFIEWPGTDDSPGIRCVVTWVSGPTSLRCTPDWFWGRQYAKVTRVIWKVWRWMRRPK